MTVCWLLLLTALTADFSGQTSGWVAAGYGTSWFGQAGLRWVPTLDAGLPLDEHNGLDCEVAADYCWPILLRPEAATSEPALKPYRAWARLFGERSEVRAGLQKVNFGSATLLRPLQWFDRLDPRDPLGVTDGVYGLLGRYYFQSNANLWGWGLVGNDKPKGWEQFGSDKWTPEFGGRAQIPLPRGEAAATYHHRRFPAWTVIPPSSWHSSEDRIGLDGKWDIGIGVSFEATLSRQSPAGLFGGTKWQRMVTAGLDYTFGFDNGLGLVAEHMVADWPSGLFGSSSTGEQQLSALMLSCPVSLLDNLRGFVYFDWKGRGLYRLVSWQRTYDRWRASVAAFWNPDVSAGLVGATGTAGKGIVLTVAYDH